MAADSDAVALSWSGGKDSALALRALREEQGIEPAALLTTFTEDYDRISMHGVRMELARAQAALAREFIAAGFEAVLVCVDPEQLDPSFAGRPFDEALLADLPPGADPCGENGEFHTFVHAGPVFDRPIDIELGEAVTRDGFAFRDIAPAGALA